MVLLHDTDALGDDTPCSGTITYTLHCYVHTTRLYAFCHVHPTILPAKQLGTAVLFC